KVTVKIDLELEKTFEDIPIEMNDADDVDATFVNPSDGEIDIIATGSVETISALKNEDSIAKIDVEGLEEGEHEVDVIIEGPDNDELNTTDSKIRIDIQLLE